MCMTARVRVGLIGASEWGSFMYVPAVTSHPRAQLVAVCSRNPESGGRFATENGIPAHFTDYREMLSSGLDAVIVAPPDDLHCQMTLAALDAGLHVLCDKPLALNSRDAEVMLQRAQASGCKHMVYFTWRWQPAFQYLKALVDSGYVGRPLRVQLAFIGGWGHARNYQWRHDGDRANGVLGDLGSHMIDMAIWLNGRIASVSAHAPRMIDRSGFDGTTPRAVNDTAHLTLEFANGAQGTVDVTTLAHLGSSAMRLSARVDGTGGSVDVELEPFGPNTGARVRGLRMGEENLLPMPVPREYLAEPTESLFGAYIQRPVGARLFIDSIIDDFKPEPGFEAGVAVQRVIDAALVSHAERRSVDI